MQNETMNDFKRWQTQATAYELLAFAYRYPDASLATVVASGEWAEAAHEVVEVLGLNLPDSWETDLATYQDADPEELLHTLRAEATRLFVGAPHPAVSPFEGARRAADEGVQALLFVNPHSMDVERFMKSCGAGRPEGTNEPLDHIATELEFLQWLCMLEADMVEAPEGIDAPEDGWTSAHARFLEEHVRVWMPQFADAVVEQSREGFYRVAAKLLKAVIASEV